MRRSRATAAALMAAALSAALVGPGPLAGTHRIDGKIVHVTLDRTEDALYPGERFTVRLTFRGEGDATVTLGEEALSRGAFSVKDARGRPPRKTRPGTPPPGGLTLAGFDTVEKIVDLSDWYPDLTRRAGAWEVGWKHGELEAEPFTVKITKAHDPRKDRKAIVETDLGTMTWTLMSGYAPKHVKHFVDLARQGFYDGLTIFRASPGLYAVGGDPRGDGTGGWDKLLPPEIAEDITTSMGLVGAMRQETSMTSHCVFFILLGPNDYMKGKQTFFARVTDGIEVVARLFRVPRRGQGQDLESELLVEPVKIRRVTIRK